MKRKALIFDLDGTLVNSLPDIAAAMNRSLVKSGLPTFPVEAYREKVGNGVFKIAERSVGSRTDCFDRVLADYMADYAQNCAVETYAYPGIPELLASLRQESISACVLSNKDEKDVHTVLDFCFPSYPWRLVRGRQDGVPLKPDPAPVLAILMQLSLSKADAAFVGDAAPDIRCGKAAGLCTVGVTWGFRSEEELRENGADYIVHRPEEILRLPL